MVSLLLFIPLLVTLAFGGLLLGVTTNPFLHGRFTRVARVIFEPYIDETAEKHKDRKQLLQSAYVAETYSAYAVRSYLYAICLGLIGGVLGAYLIGGLILLIPIIGESISSPPAPLVAALGPPSTWSVAFSPLIWLVLLVVTALISGVLTGVISYQLRWQILSGKAKARKRRINESLPRTVAFLYAQSRGGMPFGQVMETLAANQSVYGETAAEITVASRQMTLFGTDMITAIKEMAQRTPSEEFKTFSENLSTVLQSDQNLPRFLKQQY
jgi:flagellar protein FlaJ